MGFRRRNQRRKQLEAARKASQKLGGFCGGAGRRRLALEPLEDRRMLATFIVTNTDDLTVVNGTTQTRVGSLRWAVEQANANEDTDTIVFDYGIFGGQTGGGSTTIQLEVSNMMGGALVVTQPVNIYGPGPGKLTIRAAGGNRIFDFNIGDDDQVRPVSIGGVTLTGGNASGGTDDDAGNGGAILNRENLTLTEVVVTDNSASQYGGGLYTVFGRANVQRSLFSDNSAGQSGGAIANGPSTTGDTGTTDGPRAQTTIENTTIVSNSAGGDLGGGGVMNNDGTVNIRSSTIVGNIAKAAAGVAGYGNPLPMEEGADPPPAINFVYVKSSIVWGNLIENMGMTAPGEDIATVGTAGEGDMEMDLLEAVTSQGFNLFGVVGLGVTPGMDPDLGPGSDPAFVNADGDEEGLITSADLVDYGGSTDVLAITAAGDAVDAGDSFSRFDQRGRHFARAFTDGGMDQIPDVGAYELQKGQFFVDALVDESDLQYSRVYSIETIFGQKFANVFGYENAGAPGDFTLREALEFSEKNPELDDIRFASQVQTEDDPTPSSAPTILLTVGDLRVVSSVNVFGPSYPLEVDAGGVDPTPGAPVGDGSRVFEINDGDNTNLAKVSISNLTLMGGDKLGSGGAIFNREDLTLTQVTLKNNSATNDGGAIASQYGPVKIENSTLNNNRAGDDGGGIYVDLGGTVVTVLNTTLSGNSASDRGGGAANNNGTLKILHSTITNNNAGSTRGSGVAGSVITGATPTTEVYSSIIAGNFGNDVDRVLSGVTPVGTFTSLGYNIVGRGNAIGVFTAATNDTVNVLNPLLTPLGDFGGPVQVHMPVYDPAGGQISPVIDAGNPNNVPGTPSTDQRGDPHVRVFDVPDVAPKFPGGKIDVGAVELQGVSYLVNSTGDDLDGDFGPGSFSLREAIQLSNLNPLPDVISFDPTVFGFNDPLLSDTIFLGGTQGQNSLADMAITDSVIIKWDVAATGDMLRIEAGGLDDPSNLLSGSRVFTIDDSLADHLLDVRIEGFAIEGATSPFLGGVVLTTENLILENMNFSNNRTDSSGILSNLPDPPIPTGLHGGVVAILGSAGNPLPTLQIVNALATGNQTNGLDSDGGVVYADRAIVSISGSTITGNATLGSSSQGGAVFLKDSTFTALQSSFTSSLTLGALSRGGGVYAENSTLTFVDSVIGGNATVGSDSGGGGIYLTGGSAQFSNSVVGLNSTLGTLSSGAGIVSFGATLSMADSLVTLNVSSGLFAPGGGLALYGGTATLVGSSVSGNSAAGSAQPTQGGGIYNSNGHLEVRDTTIDQNQALGSQGDGGGLYNDGAQDGTASLIINSTIAKNAAARGGGVFNADGKLDVKHSTIVENSASVAGGGLASVGSAATTTTVYSTILSGNPGFGVADVSDVALVNGGEGSIISLGYNLVGVGPATAAFNKPTDRTGITDPKLSPLQDNGSPADPNLPRRFTHAPLDGSPAVNAGPTVADPSLPDDQRGTGFPRFLAGRMDIGAVESTFSSLVVGDFGGDGFVDGADLLLWQRGLGKSGPAVVTADGDANGDKVVNAADLGLWRTNFGTPAVALQIVAAGSSFSAAVSSQQATDAALATDDQAARLASVAVERSAASLARQRVRSREAWDAAWDAVPATRRAKAVATLPELAARGLEDRPDGENEGEESPAGEIFALLGGLRRWS